MLTWIERIARAIAALFGINVGGNDRTGEVQTLQAQLAACEEQIERYAETVRDLEAVNARLRDLVRRSGLDPGELFDQLAAGATADVPAQPAPVLPAHPPRPR